MRSPGRSLSLRQPSEAARRGPKLRASSRAPGTHARARAPGLRSRWWAPSGPARMLQGGRVAEFGGPGPDSEAGVAAAGSAPHPGASTPPARSARLGSAPRPPALCGGTPGLPPNRDGGTIVPAARAVPGQVDMAVALRRVRISEKYGKSYLCLLHAVFVAGEFPPRARRPAASAPRSLPGAAGRPARTLCLSSHPAHPSPLRGAPVVPRAGRGAAGGRAVRGGLRGRVSRERWGRTASSRSASRGPETGLPRAALPFCWSLNAGKVGGGGSWGVASNTCRGNLVQKDAGIRGPRLEEG